MPSDLTSAEFDLAFNFTRASTGAFRDRSGALQVAPAHAARFDHHADGTPRGLLIARGAQFGTGDRAAFDPLMLPLELLTSETSDGRDVTIFHRHDPGTGDQRRAYYSRNAPAAITALLRQLGHHREIGVIQGFRAPVQLTGPDDLAATLRYRGQDWQLPSLIAANRAGAVLLADADQPLLSCGAEANSLAAIIVPVSYVHGGIEVDPNPAATKTWAALDFAAGCALIVVSQAGSYPSGVTLVAGGESIIATRLLQQDAGSGYKGFEVWQASIAAAGPHDVVIAGAAGRHVMAWGSIVGAKAAPFSKGSNSPLHQVGPHLVPDDGDMIVPAGGLALAVLQENGGAVISPANAGFDHIDEGRTVYQSETNGLALAKLTETGQVSFGGIGFGSYARGFVVWEPL